MCHELHAHAHENVATASAMITLALLHMLLWPPSTDLCAVYTIKL